MCVAFPNAGTRSDRREPFRKRAILFLPRALALLVMLLRFLLAGLLQTTLERRRG